MLRGGQGQGALTSFNLGYLKGQVCSSSTQGTDDGLGSPAFQVEAKQTQVPDFVWFGPVKDWRLQTWVVL